MSRTGVIIPIQDNIELDPIPIIGLLRKEQEYYFCFVVTKQHYRTAEGLQNIIKTLPEQTAVVQQDVHKSKTEAIVAGVKHLSYNDFIENIALLDSDFTDASVTNLTQTLHQLETIDNLKITIGSTLKDLFTNILNGFAAIFEPSHRKQSQLMLLREWSAKQKLNYSHNSQSELNNLL